MCIVDLLNIPVSISRTGQHWNCTIWAATGQNQPEIIRSPANRIHCRRTECVIVHSVILCHSVWYENQKREVTRGVVACVFIHLIPGAVLLLPDDHLPVVGAGCQDVAVHGVSPGHLPHWTLMAVNRVLELELNRLHGNPSFSWVLHIPPQISHKDLPSVFDVKDLYRAIRGAGGQSGAVIIHLSIMLNTERQIRVIMLKKMQ